jgi:hypothetical protein
VDASPFARARKAHPFVSPWAKKKKKLAWERAIQKEAMGWANKGREGRVAELRIEVESTSRHRGVEPL